MPETQRSLFALIPGQVSSPLTRSQTAADISYSGQPFLSGNIQNNKSGSSFRMNSQTQSTANAVLGQLGEAAVNAAANKIESAIKNVNLQPKKPNPDGGRGMSRHSSGYALSKAPNPLEVKLDSGITPNTYTSDYLDAMENTCSPLHLTSGRVQIPNYASSRLFDYFNQVIAFDIQTKAQANVGFNLSMGAQFTPDKILAAMNALLDAMQVYFFYMSIITYHSDPANKNEGMIKLRTTMGPSTLESLTLLGRRLSDTPCPPRMLELCRYLSGNYQSGDNQGSSIIKLVPTILRDTNILLTNDINTCLTNLSLTANNDVYTLLRRAVPQWNPKILYDIPTAPLFDLNFLTIFANAPFSIYDTATDNFPKVASNSDVIAYNSFTNELDGVAFALTSAYNTTTNSWLPGLLTPVTAPDPLFANTRKSFYEVGGVKAFYQVRQYPFLVKSRSETYFSPTTTTVSSCHLFGTDRCLSVNGDTIRETSFKVLDYLMSADLISNPNQSGFNSRVNGNISRSRGRSKKL